MIINHLKKNLQCCQSSFGQTNQIKSFSHNQSSNLDKIPWKHAFMCIVVNPFHFPEFHMISTGLHYTVRHFLPAQESPQLSCKANQHSVTLPISQMTRHISVAYSDCQEEESHHPTNCFCSSDGAALRRRSQLQHQKKRAGSYCRARSTGKALPRSWQIPAEKKWAWWPAVIDV